MKIQLRHSFEDIVNIDNLLEAWKEFLQGKRHKHDVQEFSLRLYGQYYHASSRPYHRVLRTTTKRRMFRRITESSTPETLNSYLGLLGHGDTYKLKKQIGI